MRHRIVNWREYQHYKGRRPPWIKVHKSILASDDWVMGSDATKLLAIVCMMAAQMDKAGDGSFNSDPIFLKKIASLDATPCLKELVSSGFIEQIEDASILLAKEGQSVLSSVSVSVSEDGGVGEGNVCIGDPPKTRKQKAASLATEYRFRIPGVRKQMLEELTPVFEEKLRVYGDDKYDFILGKIKGERDKSLAMFHFWKLCGMDGDSLLPPPPTAPAGKSAEQLRHESNLERLAKMNGGQRANG